MRIFTVTAFAALLISTISLRISLKTVWTWKHTARMWQDIAIRRGAVVPEKDLIKVD